MKVSEIMVKPVCAEHDDSISKVLAKMEEGRMHQMPLLHNGKYEGMVVLRDLLSSNYDPAKTKIGIFKVNVPILSTEESLEKAAIEIINSGYRALPVISKKAAVGIVSLNDLIKYLSYSREELAGHFICDVVTVNEGDDLGKALHLMDERNVSRLPVLNSEGKIVGCFDDLSVIKFLKRPRESVGVSRITGVEKESLKGFLVKNFMRGTATLEVDDFSLEKINNYLQSSEEVILTVRGKPAGIVIPRDLIEHAIIEDMPPIQVSNYAGIEPMLYSRFYGLVEEFVKKFSKMFSITRVFVYADTSKSGGKNRHSLRLRIITPKKVFMSHSTAFDLIDATHQIIRKMEGQLEVEHGKMAGAPIRERVRMKLKRQMEVSRSSVPVGRNAEVGKECTGCSTCASLYPDLFEIRDDGHATLKKGVKIDKKKLKEVMRSCPIQAIKLVKK